MYAVILITTSPGEKSRRRANRLSEGGGRTAQFSTSAFAFVPTSTPGLRGGTPAWLLLLSGVP